MILYKKRSFFSTELSAKGTHNMNYELHSSIYFTIWYFVLWLSSTFWSHQSYVFYILQYYLDYYKKAHHTKYWHWWRCWSLYYQMRQSIQKWTKWNLRKKVFKNFEVIWSVKTDYITSNFLKAVFHRFY